MAYFITDDCKDLIKDIRNFCDNEMKEQVYEAEKLGYSDEAAADEIIMEILGGIQERAAARDSAGLTALQSLRRFPNMIPVSQ